MQYRVYLLAALLLAGCDQDIVPIPPMNLPTTRVVATVYSTQSDSGQTACYIEPSEQSVLVTPLENNKLVDLVDVQEGVYQHGNQFWLHVYPRMSHRPDCYILVEHLVPVS